MKNIKIRMIRITKEELVDKLLDYFLNEDERLKDYRIPNNYEDKRLFLRGIINIRPPYEISEDILELEDELLKLELKEKNIADVNSLDFVEDKICLYLGDITTLIVDAIVNACNSSLLGCFIPNHSCIDNAIHTYAGIRLRLACNKIMQGKEEEVGKAKITLAYNLPSKYVIHTVGPIVRGKLNDKEKDELKNCYISCLDLARENNIKTIAFPAISTGVFSFPKDDASKIAVSTVRDYLVKYPDAFERVIFNVFTKEDLSYYERLFRN